MQNISLVHKLSLWIHDWRPGVYPAYRHDRIERHGSCGTGFGPPHRSPGSQLACALAVAFRMRQIRHRTTTVSGINVVRGRVAGAGLPESAWSALCGVALAGVGAGVVSDGWLRSPAGWHSLHKRSRHSVGRHHDGQRYGVVIGAAVAGVVANAAGLTRSRDAEGGAQAAALRLLSTFALALAMATQLARRIPQELSRRVQIRRWGCSWRPAPSGNPCSLARAGASRSAIDTPLHAGASRGLGRPGNIGREAVANPTDSKAVSSNLNAWTASDNRWAWISKL